MRSYNTIVLGCGTSTATKSASSAFAHGWDHWARKLQPHESSDGKIEENVAVPIGVLFFEAEPGPRCVPHISDGCRPICAHLDDR